MKKVNFYPYPGPGDEGKKEKCFFCKDIATLKAVCGKSAVRCCDNGTCMERAKIVTKLGCEKIMEEEALIAGQMGYDA